MTTVTITCITRDPPWLQSISSTSLCTGNGSSSLQGHSYQGCQLNRYRHSSIGPSAVSYVTPLSWVHNMMLTEA